MTPRADERGSVPLAVVVILALSFAAAIGLVIDGDHILAARRHADAIAFQAARAGAQALDPNALAHGQPQLDPTAAEAAATRTANALLAADHVAGRVTRVVADANHVDVTVNETANLTAAALFGSAHLTVTGHATVRVAAGTISEGS